MRRAALKPMSESAFTKQSMRNIGRIDHDRLERHCWRVTLQIRRRIYIRNFSDRRYRGRDQALGAAQAFRDEMLAEHATMTRRDRCQVVRKNNRSGVSGVTRLIVTASNGQQAASRVYWVARWPGGGKTVRQRRFSVKKYGEWGAYLRAVEARQHGLATMDDEAA